VIMFYAEKFHMTSRGFTTFIAKVIDNIFVAFFAISYILFISCICFCYYFGS